MLQVSTRGRYALRAMVDVAIHANDSPVPRQDIAERQNISSDYIAQLFRELSSAGLAEGIRGPKGGYVLAQEADSISAYDVIKATEGPIALVGCVESEGPSTCEHVKDCVTYPLWKHLSASIQGILEAVSLKDLYTKEYTRLDELKGDKTNG